MKAKIPSLLIPGEFPVEHHVNCTCSLNSVWKTQRVKELGLKQNFK